MYLLPLEEELWEKFSGAYGNICEEMKLLLGNPEDVPPQEKIRWMDEEEKDNYTILFENVCDELWHQMSFYEATYPAMPYFLILLERAEEKEDFLGQFTLISAMGGILATDIADNPRNIEIVPQEMLDAYEETITILKEKIKKFYQTYKEEIKDIEDNEKIEFLIAMVSVLGDRELSYHLSFGLMEEVLLYCTDCNMEDEENTLDDPDFCEKIVPAPIPDWDGISFTDTYTWFYGVLSEIGMEQWKEYLPYYYGTYTCPECGAEKRIWDFIRAYYFEMD